jgi:hypothetical protein
MSGKPKDLGIPPEARKAANHPISRKTRKSQLGRRGHDPDVALGHAAQGYQGFAICVTFISAILYRPQTREAAAKMRAEIRAARLLGVAEPARELEAIATATPSSIGKPELRAFYNYTKSVRGHHMALAMIATLSAAFTWGQESILWRLGPNPRDGMEFDHPDGRIVLVAMPEFSAWVAASDAIERFSIGDSFYLALFTGQRQTDRLIMRNECDVEGRHAVRQSKTGELVDIKEAPQLTARLNASRARIKALKLRLQLETVPPELIVNEDNGEPYDESTYRHWVCRPPARSPCSDSSPAILRVRRSSARSAWPPN